ncbi:MAG: RNA-binding protein [Parcubacteria group bacterium]|nr:RNA-binding protein [Parcubacteria group bacterium]
MAKKLYVGNLSYNTNDAQLKDFFSAAGAVETATVIIDKMTGRSRGFGFVEMPNDDEADKAIETLNGKDLDGRAIVVNEARPMGERAPRSGGFGGGGGGRGGRRDFHRDF